MGQTWLFRSPDVLTTEALLVQAKRWPRSLPGFSANSGEDLEAYLEVEAGKAEALRGLAGLELTEFTLSGRTAHPEQASPDTLVAALQGPAEAFGQSDIVQLEAACAGEGLGEGAGELDRIAVGLEAGLPTWSLSLGSSHREDRLGTARKLEVVLGRLRLPVQLRTDETDYFLQAIPPGTLHVNFARGIRGESPLYLEAGWPGRSLAQLIDAMIATREELGGGRWVEVGWCLRPGFDTETPRALRKLLGRALASGFEVESWSFDGSVVVGKLKRLEEVRAALRGVDQGRSEIELGVAEVAPGVPVSVLAVTTSAGHSLGLESRQPLDVERWSAWLGVGLAEVA